MILGGAFSMKASIRGRIDLALPATVTSFELIGDRTPFMRTNVMTLEIRGPFVGRRGDQSLWDEIEPEALASLLKGFEGQDLLAVESDPGWLHLDFTDGWIRVVAVKSLGVVFFRSGGDGGQGGATVDAVGAVVGLEHVGQVSQ